ncbi:unnamed protein product [Cuscuta epithymum]|uniref:Uncharacterized protein n=1 Tax=Cuscuta epithymum TaxID=186058 RepID=A0AAV0FNT0_9ASTE|nr:unnamed protein product [Cuscuta epithymum]CAH9136879.1 unnamed protein product [Cuscuta epithymum]
MVTMEKEMRARHRANIKFGNIWLKEAKRECRDLIIRSRWSSENLSIWQRLEMCGHDLSVWRKYRSLGFHSSIEVCNARLNQLWSEGNNSDIGKCMRTKATLLDLLHRQNKFCQQREKEF